MQYKGWKVFLRGSQTRDDRIGWLDGLVIGTPSRTVVIDPTRIQRVPQAARVLVSHAHADHTRGFNHKGLKQSTPETRDIHSVLNDHEVANFAALRLDQRIVLDDLEIRALNAGHMLGSAQFLIHTPVSTILYTGDINCVDTLTTKAAQPQRCDVLVVEATYGSPFYRFPPRESVYARIVEWAVDTIKQGSVPCFHVYAAGKAQEIIRLFNVYTHLPVVVNPILDGVNETYRRSGQNLEWLPSNSKEGRNTLDKVPCVYVTTPSDKRSIGRRVARAYATGWALSLKGRNVAFPLSSHADFDQLVSFVKACCPERVYIFTGFAEELRSTLKTRLGMEARVVPFHLQRTLFEDY